MIRWRKKRRFYAMDRLFLGFAALLVLLLAERLGIRYQSGDFTSAYLGEGEQIQMKFTGDDKTCLLIVDSRAAESVHAEEQFFQILTDMRVPFERWDLAEQGIPDLSGRDTAVFAVGSVAPLGESVLDLCEWVGQGGRLMFGLPLQKETTLDMIAGKLGMLELGYEQVAVEDLKLAEGFMLGGDVVYQITDPYDSALSVSLNDDCQVYASSADGRIPLIWEHRYQEGRFVLVNFGYCEKAYRGIYAAAYSLLEDVCIYPVINGSAFYIDDFPSPVPSGAGEYIMRDYGMEVSEFYSSVWWPDMIQLARNYGYSYTGMIIENYGDQVSGTLPRNRDTSRFNYFGNSLLELGGELGLHGYNHQPLCTDSYQYEEDLGYNQWESVAEMQNAMWELSEFSKGLFPDVAFSVYVPPSNVLSPEGRRLLADGFPEIQAIASVYLPSGSAYEQEFEVAEDGMVETPRIIAGSVIDSYMHLAAFSELNFHYVNSHFIHPDDILDEDRGAALGWEKLKSGWAEYLEWLYRAAPGIRNVTGSGLAGAVERYCNISLWKLDTPDDLYITVNGLTDEAWLFIRVNEGELGEVTGGELTHLTGNLYLLRATQQDVEIRRHRQE